LVNTYWDWTEQQLPDGTANRPPVKTAKEYRAEDLSVPELRKFAGSINAPGSNAYWEHARLGHRPVGRADSG